MDTALILRFMLGALGGMLLEAWRWWNFREQNTLPHWWRKPHYWLITLAMVVCSGIIVAAYRIDISQPILAIHIGSATPAIIATFASPPRNISPVAGGGTTAVNGPIPPTIREFLAFRRTRQ